MEWNTEERRWVQRAKRLFRDKPPSVMLYTVDGEIAACKAGVSSRMLDENIAPGGAITACAMLDDGHDSHMHLHPQPSGD